MKKPAVRCVVIGASVTSGEMADERSIRHTSTPDYRSLEFPTGNIGSVENGTEKA